MPMATPPINSDPTKPPARSREAPLPDRQLGRPRSWTRGMRLRSYESLTTRSTERAKRQKPWPRLLRRWKDVSRTPVSAICIAQKQPIGSGSSWPASEMAIHEFVTPKPRRCRPCHYLAFKASSLASTSRFPMPRSAAIAAKACGRGFVLPASQA